MIFLDLAARMEFQVDFYSAKNEMIQSSEMKCHVQQFGQRSSNGIKSLSDL